MIDSQQASAALNDINDVVQRVRQSRIYHNASLIIIMWGVLVFVGYLANHTWPPQGYTIWAVVDLIGIAGSIAVAAFSGFGPGAGVFALRLLVAFLLFIAFGIFCSAVLGHFGPRQMLVFWPLFTLLFYALAGLWFGYAFIVIALCSSALIVTAYFHAGPALLLWMAVAHGGALILGGLWMRRI
ncbi:MULTISPECIES: hypothetical protein [Bradyrhizobium]|jgi:hypothetical protein|uniref:hypothetical protein n=1 Tax=Bradyrhizobium TaxID=374 RepID=UPI000418396D|nr:MULTISPECIES: hypothetical protein [Bradyrhizobium]KIU49200.1 hypothetical protein QU41_12195 [Bradyrhizobium elkanii]OCX28356.1 hypothetical protein QU42_25195 [Bradyrhizobium sp. UASWS1016]